MDIRLVVFDFDGMLIGVLKVFLEVKEEFRKRFLERGISEEFIGDLMFMYEILIEIFEKMGIFFDEFYLI